MYTTISKSMVALLACLVAVAFAGVASAFPNKGGGCNAAGCHTAPGGTMTESPNPLNVQLSADGLLTFNVTSLGGGDPSAITVQFGDVNVFNNVSSGAGSSITWTKRTSGGNGLTSNTFSATGSYVLDLAVGAGAPTGSFPLTLWLSGAGPITSQYQATLNITNIPEPAALGLFLFGAVVAAFRRTRNA